MNFKFGNYLGAHALACTGARFRSLQKALFGPQNVENEDFYKIVYDFAKSYTILSKLQVGVEVRV